jgi:hydroxylamine reductase (hybrid-cluster protein)
MVKGIVMNAVDCSILPFGEQSVMDGISKCYVDSMNSRPKSDDELAQDAFKTIACKLKKSKQFLDISQVNHGFSIEKLQNAFGYLTSVNGKNVRVIRSEALKRITPKNEYGTGYLYCQRWTIV